MIFFAVLIGLLGLRFLSAALHAIIMMFRAEAVPTNAKQTLYRDLIMGVLCLVLAVVMII